MRAKDRYHVRLILILGKEMTALAKTARKISDSDEKDKSSTNFIHTPKTVIGGSGENLDNQSVTLSVEKHEGNGEDNYVVMDTSIVLEMEITPEKPLITLSSTNQPENTSFKPKQTFAKEPQFQEINRGDNNKSVNKTYPISMDAGMKQKITGAAKMHLILSN